MKDEKRMEVGWVVWFGETRECGGLDFWGVVGVGVGWEEREVM